MQINNKVGSNSNAANAPKVSAAANTPAAANAPKIVGDKFKARDAAPADTRTDDQKLADFVAQNKGSNPGLDQAAENLSLAGHLKADAVLIILSGLVGAGAREVITQFTNKDQAFAYVHAMSTDPTERWVIASKYPLDIKTAMMLAADSDLSVRYALAVRMKNNDMKFDKAVLEVMANDPNPLIRSMAASSDKLSSDTINRLASRDTEPSPQVRMAALSNPNIDKRTKELAMQMDSAVGGVLSTMDQILGKNGDDRTKLNFLRDNPSVGLTRKMMENLAASNDPGVREALARRPDVPDALLNQIYEHRGFTFWQSIKKLFGMDPGVPAGSPHYETNRIVLMAIANNPNVSPATLTSMVQRVNKNDQQQSGVQSRINPTNDLKLGIPTTSLDPNSLAVDIVARSIVGNPKTDPTIKMLANDKMPVPIDPAIAKQAFMAINNANALYLNGKYADAAEQYKQAIATTFHDNEEAYYELAQCELRMQRPDLARYALAQALEINNDYSPAAALLDTIDHGGGGR